MFVYRWIVLVFLTSFSNISTLKSERCLEEDSISGAVIRTNNGEVAGEKQTKIDPRQNKSVTWTSFYVR